MNSLEVLLRNDENPAAACAALLDYIQVNVYEGNALKVAEFYERVPQILNKLFGDNGAPGWIQKIASRANGEIATVYELLGPTQGKGGMNLFRAMLFPAGPVTPYTVPLSIFPEYTQYLIRSKQYSSLSQFFHNLAERPETQLKCLECDCVALTPCEYYLTMFLHAAKQYNGKVEDNTLLTYEEGSDQSPETVVSRTYARDPLLVLFARYVPALISPRRPGAGSCANIFEFFLMAVDEMWLSEVYNAEKLLPAKADKSSPFYSPSLSAVPMRCPNFLMLECVYALMYFLEQRIPVQSGYKSSYSLEPYSRKESQYIDSIQVPFYLFLKLLLRYWNQTAAASSDISLCYVCTIWMNYIKPWKTNAALDELFFVTEPRDDNPNDPGMDLLHNTELEYANFVRQKQIKAEQSEQAVAWTDFIMGNIIFYTDVFAEVVRAYSYKRKYDLLDVTFLASLKGKKSRCVTGTL